MGLVGTARVARRGRRIVGYGVGPRSKAGLAVRPTSPSRVLLTARQLERLPTPRGPFEHMMRCSAHHASPAQLTVLIRYPCKMPLEPLPLPVIPPRQPSSNRFHLYLPNGATTSCLPATSSPPVYKQLCITFPVTPQAAQLQPLPPVPYGATTSCLPATSRALCINTCVLPSHPPRQPSSNRFHLYLPNGATTSSDLALFQMTCAVGGEGTTLDIAFTSSSTGASNGVGCTGCATVYVCVRGGRSTAEPCLHQQQRHRCAFVGLLVRMHAIRRAAPPPLPSLPNCIKA